MAVIPRPPYDPSATQYSTWESMQDYNHALMRQLQHEVEEHWKFMHYLKTHYPEALAEWNALNKIAES